MGIRKEVVRRSFKNETVQGIFILRVERNRNVCHFYTSGQSCKELSSNIKDSLEFEIFSRMSGNVGRSCGVFSLQTVI
jgi:hypothetical protein